MGLVKNYGSDSTFALSTISSSVSLMLQTADAYTGSRDVTLRKLGTNGENIFPSNSKVLPSNWIQSFSSWLYSESKSINSPLYDNVTRFNFTTIEMKSLYNLLSNSTILGAAVLPSTECSTNITAPKCLELGFMYLVEKRKVARSNPSTENIINQQLKTILCPDINSSCLMHDEKLLNAIELFVTTHLTKLSMYLVVDSANYGLLTTRSQKELSVGYNMTIGSLTIGVPGFLANDTDLQKAKDTKDFVEYYKCSNRLGKKGNTIAGK